MLVDTDGRTVQAAAAVHSRASERGARAQIETLMRAHRTARTGDIERDIPFSWTSVFIAVFSYVLLLSDVLRTGMAIRGVAYTKLEPNRHMSLGPMAYPILHVLRNDTTERMRPVWIFKLDSTSIGMRAVVEHLRVEHWPPCVLYKSVCEQPSLNATTVFGMLDSLVTAVAQHKSTRTPINLTLRTTSAWIDRAHHFILPRFFSSVVTRTNQAIFYDADTLRAPGFQFCSTTRVRPYACLDFWTNFAPICDASSKARCQGTTRVFDHALSHFRLLQQRYVGMTLDLVMLESQDDISKASLSFQGQKWFDLAVVTRVRDCSSGACITIAIDDYRYEGISFTSNAEDLYFVIAILRCLGQSYVWLRVTMLVVGCYTARAVDPKFADASFFQRTSVAVRTLFLVPSQVVTYGSVFPIACYVTAHTLDSATVYELVAQKFNTPGGIFRLNLEEFVQLSAVSMRSVWVLATVLHVLVYVRTHHRWSHAKGVPGVPEFSISFVSCLTIMAQFRSIHFRDTRILSIAEVVPSDRIAAIRAFSYDNVLGVCALIVRGNRLDAKCLIAAAIAYVAIFLVVWCVLSVLNRLNTTKQFSLIAISRTRVSYAASTLWSTNALVTSWDGVQLRKSHGGASQSAIIRQYEQLHKMTGSSRRYLGVFKRRVACVTPEEILKVSRMVRQVFTRLDERNDEVESIVYLMNLAVMTDPIALMWLWWQRGERVCVFRSLTSERLFLVPQDAIHSLHDELVVRSDYELLMVVNTTDLAWQDLLYCG